MNLSHDYVIACVMSRCEVLVHPPAIFPLVLVSSDLWITQKTLNWAMVAMLCFTTTIAIKRSTWIRITGSPRIGSAIHTVFFTLWPLSTLVFAIVVVLEWAGIKM